MTGHLFIVASSSPVNAIPPPEHHIAATAQALRQAAIDRLNSGLSDNPRWDEAGHAACEDITIRLPAGWWGICGLVILATGLITPSLWMHGGSVFLRLVLPCLFLLLSLLSISLQWVKPVEVGFCKSRRTVTVIYPFKQARTYGFEELESIQSILRVTGDNDPGVSLELMLKSRERLVLKAGPPDWSPTSPLFGFSGCCEPKEFASLRHQIAALTGTRNLGFRG